ncbi:ATP-dependent translocase ABCB1 isoform X1 [Scyliorhinus canicula]|uniref:ATP-dependent translocase ABCB1 isoform X1 n=1 Tax=Scyliorhinus canicula TaxID=7830 RepID=UPI0018F2C7D8|nr:ATP-dependent translocase ABCB1 isoform X1 [Scyliorhinus canicula]XP_038653375.1 ATP-dependent translocase ABCB1 isoform X1 [Scyliorhinus canicula]
MVQDLGSNQVPDIAACGSSTVGYDNPSYQEGANPDTGHPKNGKEKNLKEGRKLKKAVGFFELFRFADRLDILMMTIGLFCAVLQGISLPLMIIVFGQMTDSFVKSGTLPNISTAVLNNSSTNACFEIPGLDLEADMTRFAHYFVGLGFAVLIFGSLHVCMFLLAGTRQTGRIRQKFFHAILHQEMAWFDSNQIGELNTKLTDGINTIKDGLGDKISIFMQLFSTCVAGFITGFVTGWKLTLVILAVSPLIMVSVVVWTKLLTLMTCKELTAYAKAGAVAEEVLTAIRTVFAFNGQQKALEKYELNLKTARDIGIRRAIVTNVSIGLQYFLIYGCYALAFWYGSKLVVDEPENYSIGQVLTVFLSVMIGALSLGQAAPNLEDVAKAQGAAFDVYSLITKHRPIDSSSKEGHMPESIKGNIEFKNIHFTYPTRPDVKILNGLSIKVLSGKTVALVGASGCGKSTTIQLLQRFYDPEAGEITVDGHDIRTLNVKWLRQHIGVVSQEPVLFATTVAENIRYGREDVTDGEIEQAAREANAYDFITMLPDRFNTMVGERGAQLSGGQKQRIAIARALVRNPKILLLDEATSALDTQSEYVVQAALDKARAGRTTIVIAHRLSTIRTADVIAAFNEGVVTEEGTHSELMNRKGIYYSLVMQQSSHVESDSDEEMDKALEEVKQTENDEHTSVNILNRNSFKRKSSRKGHQINSSEPSQTIEDKEQEKELEESFPEVSFSGILALNKSEWPYIVTGIMAAFVAGAVIPSFAVVFSRIIGVFAITDPEVKRQRTAMFSLIFLALGAIYFVSYSLQGYLFGKSGEILTMRLRGLSFKAILRQEIGWFDDCSNAVGVLITRLATDASQVKGATGTRLGLMTMNACTLGAAIVLSFIFGWQLTFIVLACIPFLIGANIIAMRSTLGHASKDNKSLETSGKISTEAVENIRTIVSLTREDAFYERYLGNVDKPYRTSLSKVPFYGFSCGLAQSIPFFVNAAIFRFGAWLIVNCFMVFEDVFLVFAVIVFAAMNIGQTSSFAPDYTKAKISAQKIMQLLQRKPLIDSYSEEGEKLSNFEGNIELRNVKFMYPTRPDIQVLKGLNVKVNKGQTLALVGSSGCGKSTSVQLLERFYEAIDGQVLADGKDIRGLHLSWFRHQMGIVSQEPMLFDCSIAENIEYGDNSKAITQQEIEEAAKAANIHSFITSLPNGYNTRVGDKGAQLSGGQKQRVAIARALIRKPKILLLDEATSALDNESEKIVQQALDEARQGRTCIIIAHRLSTIQNADIIAVIQNGRVVEEGTHKQLLLKEGAYYALVHAQVHN